MENGQIVEDEVIELHFVRSASGGDAESSGSPYSYTISVSSDPEELLLLQDMLAQLQDISDRQQAAEDPDTRELLEDVLTGQQDQTKQLSQVMEQGMLTLVVIAGLIFGALLSVGLWFGRLNNK